MFYTLEYTVTALVCLITAVVIQRIYHKEKKSNAQAQEIKGIMWFGLAIFTWGIGGLFNLIMVTGFQWPPTHKVLIYFGVLISLLNSFFILLSLPSIEHGGKKNIVIQLVERFSEREFFMIFGGILVMLAIVFVTLSYSGGGIDNALIWLMDIPISVVVAFALLNALNKAFSNRKMRFMFLPSMALFILILIAVTHRIVPQDNIPLLMEPSAWSVLGTVTAISFKFLFILLFSILLYSWKFLAQKEEQQGQLEIVNAENLVLTKRIKQLDIANESHLDTIERLSRELLDLKEATKIELSDRQKEVLGNLGLWGMQKSYTEIAAEMHISVDGFQTHIHQIKKVLNISGSEGKTQLIQYAKDHELLQYATIKKG
ncbi:response regulator transcription factor [Spongiimicrobium salis]|uniref:response regulator transcription factor n=1 Tax=Spongiimicrobium salis TaxID=1667022 RepID=UPI00374D71B2